FDWILGALFRLAGPEAAQRIAVAACVLLLFWGAIYLIGEIRGARPWWVAPPLAMLCYGWVYHTGLFNFYLSMGLSLWAVALAIRPSPRRLLIAVLLLAAAFFAMVIPVAWAIGIIAYYSLATRLSLRGQITIAAASIGAIAVLRLLLDARYATLWTELQLLESLAIDQVWLFGFKYYVLALILAVLWSFLLMRLSYEKGAGEVFFSVPFQLYLITAAAVVILPTRIEFPFYRAAITFLAERMTLPLGVLLCVVVAAARPARWQQIALTVLALVYFSCIYADTRVFNTAEAEMEQLVGTLPPDTRVFTAIVDPEVRVRPWEQIIDRVCLGRCLSYANYEPYTAAFRVRTTRGNSIVVANSTEYGALRHGGYVVRHSDLPMYQIKPCMEGKPRLCLHELRAGEITKEDIYSMLPKFL
ncbi:MAG: hypothetical protein ABIZ80_18660, partial [Bryobacteraceae bacterium]